MGNLIKGPFELLFGGNVLEDVESFDFSYSVDSDDKSSVQGRKFRFYGAHQVTVKLTFLKNDVSSLAVVLPQYFVPNGGTLSSGETVNTAAGAIDVVPGGCDTSGIEEDLVIRSCGANGEDLVIKNATSEIAGVNLDDKNRTIEVEFTGQSDSATIQIFKKSGVTVIS